MHTLSAQELHDRFVDGTYSALEITEYFLKRIKQHNPQLNAFLRTLEERALKKAQELDKKRNEGLPLGKLAGVPIAVKDNIHIQGEISSCSSNFLSNYTAPFSATVTDLLEAEDAILIGKTNMDEFAMGSSNENSAMGNVGNPWNTAHSPGGSSGGSAAAVAAQLTPIALGSDTGGSIRQPAAFCGIVGYKPTYGRVSRYGLVAFGSSLDQIGPLTSNVHDAALVMEILGQHCAKDSTSINRSAESITENFPQDLKGKRIGVPYAVLKDLKDPVASNFQASLERLTGLGAELVEVDLDMLRYTIAMYYIIATAEASTNLARFDGVRYGQRSSDAKTLSEVYFLSKKEGYGPEVKRRILLGTFVLSSGYQDAYYKRAQRVRTKLIRTFNEIFQSCDLVAMPTTPTPAFRLGEILDPLEMYLSDIYTCAQNLAGIPAVSVPSGFSDDGLPMGIQLVGPQMADAAVLHAAHAFEQATALSPKAPQEFTA